MKGEGIYRSLFSQGFWERGRPARNAALARAALALALSREGRGDLSVADFAFT